MSISKTVVDVMSADLKTVESTAMVNDAAKVMADHAIGALPVTNNGKPVGMVTDRDIATRCCAHARTPFETTVKEVMTEAFYHCPPDIDVEKAAANMAELKVRRLPVVDDDKNLIGIVSLSDIALKSDVDTTNTFGAISAAPPRQPSIMSQAERLF